MNINSFFWLDLFLDARAEIFKKNSFVLDIGYENSNESFAETSPRLVFFRIWISDDWRIFQEFRSEFWLEMQLTAEFSWNSSRILIFSGKYVRWFWNSLSISIRIPVGKYFLKNYSAICCLSFLFSSEFYSKKYFLKNYSATGFCL